MCSVHKNTGILFFLQKCNKKGFTQLKISHFELQYYLFAAFPEKLIVTLLFLPIQPLLILFQEWN